MSWIAFIETSNGEVLRIIRPDGLTGGKALLSFLTAAGTVCDKINLDEDIVDWVSNFNENSKYDFCDTLEKLNNVYFSGNWDFKDNEYIFFLQRSPGLEISEDGFKRTIEKISKMWANIQELITDITVLVDEFRKGYLKDTDWYVEQDTLGDFEGLLNTLILLKMRNAENVRIRIE